jgi:hypothetical protein
MIMAESCGSVSKYPPVRGLCDELSIKYVNLIRWRCLKVFPASDEKGKMTAMFSIPKWLGPVSPQGACGFTEATLVMVRHKPAGGVMACEIRRTRHVSGRSRRENFFCLNFVTSFQIGTQKTPG